MLRDCHMRDRENLALWSHIPSIPHKEERPKFELEWGGEGELDTLDKTAFRRGS